MTPPQMHINLETLSSVGILPSRTVGAPGTQGAGVAGMQGMGVSTPSAAAVAAATVGFATDMHIPNGMMFTMGMWSMMLASGISLVITRLTGSTTSELGAIPNVHIIIAPIQTWLGINLHPPHLGSECTWPGRWGNKNWRNPLGIAAADSVDPDRDAAYDAACRSPRQVTPVRAGLSCSTCRCDAAIGSSVPGWPVLPANRFGVPG